MIISDIGVGGFSGFGHGRDGCALWLLAMSGAQTPARAQATLRGMGIQVTPENVLRLRNALDAEVLRLKALVQRHQRDLRVGECGQDPLSRPAAEVFNRTIAAHLRATTDYIEQLSGARDACHQMAISYGRCEAEISQSFAAFNRDVMPGVYAQVAQDQRLREQVHGQAGLSAPSVYRPPGGAR